MGGKGKFKKAGFFSLRNFVFLLIILTCIAAMGKFSQDIFLTMQAPQIIEVTREIMVGVVVTATPEPQSLLTPTYPYNQTPCRRDSLLRAIESGGEIVFDCNNVILIDEPIVIRNRVHLRASGELLTTLSQARDLATLFTIESGGSLTLENFTIRDMHGQIINILPGGEFVGNNCRFASNNNPMDNESLIFNQGSLNLANCVFEENQIRSGAIIWNWSGATTQIQSSIFRANRLSSGEFTGQGNLIRNDGGTLNLNSSYFLDNVAENAVNNIVLSLSGQTNIAYSLFRSNSIAISGDILANEANSMMYLNGVSFFNNGVFSGNMIRNAGNLRIMNPGVMTGACLNSGILNDPHHQCG